MKRHLRSLFQLLIVSWLVGGVGCTPPHASEKTPVRILVAGSMLIPFAKLETAYETTHPEIDLQIEGHGSIQVMRHVTELHEPTDIVVTADEALIPTLMYATHIPETENPYAGWYIRFATNRLGLAYRPESQYAEEINAENWYEIISRPDVQVGLADPRFDAAGYRALMALQLAENQTQKALIFENFSLGRFRPAVAAQEESGRTVIHIPEIVDSRPESGLVIRGASTALIALLESGDLDYAFEYESVIRQHGLSLFPLPKAVNLGVPKEAARYDTVEVQMDFQRFLSVRPTFRGAVIGYGVTIPTNAPHPTAAADFIAFLLGPEGQRIMQDNFQPLIQPPQTDNPAELPTQLQPLCVPLP